MRVFAAASALLVLALGPALAAPKGKPAPKPDPVAQSYAAMSEAERIAIQNDLIWTGDYNGTADGQFGPRAVAAVKAYQKRAGVKDTGVLNPKQRDELAAAAKKKREAVGWRVLGDGASGVRLGLPAKLVPHAAQVAGGSRWASGRGEVVVETFRIAAPGTTLEAVAERYRTLPNRKASYSLVRPDFFVFAGLQSGVKKFYVRGQFKNGEVRGFTLLYDQAMEGTLDPIAVAMSSAFAAFPVPPVALAPPPRKKVEYGSAVFIDETGHALTTHHLIDGCNVVTLAGFGPAEVVASDKAANLALLRVYGASGITPIGLADAAQTGAVTLAGIADPARQAGAGARSLVRARVVPAAGTTPAVLEPGPEPGFEGAAAIDAGGRLAGLVDLPAPTAPSLPVASPQATLIPAAAVGTFLAAQKVAAAQASRTARDALKAIARVICTRK